MKRCLKKIAASILSTAVIFTSIAFVPTNVLAADFSKVGGWNESIYAEIQGIKDGDVTSVSYSGTMTGTLTGDDFTYLVRDKNSGVRIDIPGLKAGTYSLSVETKNGTVKKDNIVVNAYDRSGYAHFNYTEGVGAYNDDGTLKANAKVIYVTEENKNTVTVTADDGTSVSGIGNILNTRGGHINVDSKGKVTSTVINTNQDILKKLAEENHPVAVRFVGEVLGGDSNTSNNPPAVSIDGLTAYDSADYGGTEGDNGMMARMQYARNITLEGVGDDASVNGWGFHFMCSDESYAAGLGRNCEVRNIYFVNYPEDAFGAEGEQNGSTITGPVERVWVHNNNFGPGFCKNPAESDKAEGDGSCDFKRGNYYTMAYNKYWDCHKTNLVGSSDSSLQYFITFHHNHYKNCMARGPLVRNSNVHMYNNVYDGQSDYALNPRANAYIFSEYNLFYQSKNCMSVTSGAIKSFNDVLTSCIEAVDGTFVTDKSQKVSSGCKYANFDIDSSLSYIPSGDYRIQTDVTQAKKVVLAESGVMKENPVSPEEVNSSILSPERQPAASVALPYKNNLNSSYLTSKTETKDNILFNLYKLAGDSISIGANEIGQDIVFNVNQPVNITMTDGGATYPAVLMNESGVAYLTGTGTAYNVPAGTYIIQPGGIQPAKTGQPLKYKESKITFLGIEAFDSDATTVTEPTTQTTTMSEASETTTNIDGSTEVTTNSDVSTETTTSVEPVPVGSKVHNVTDSGKTSDFFSITADNVSDSKGAVNYNGMTLVDCIKINTKANISFTNGVNGSLRLVFNSLSAGNKFSFDGNPITIPSDGIVVIDNIVAGTHTIKRVDGESYLYYMAYSDDTEIVSVKGDVNRDGKVDAVDASIVLKIASGLITDTSAYDTDAADCNSDGEVNVLDAIWILNKK